MTQHSWLDDVSNSHTAVRVVFSTLIQNDPTWRWDVPRILQTSHEWKSALLEVMPPYDRRISTTPYTQTFGWGFSDDDCDCDQEL